MKKKFIGKTLLLEIEDDGERVLVIGDLHLGYRGSLRESGYHFSVDLYKEIVEEMKKVFEKINDLGKGKLVDKVILLGDLKHEMGRILREEWNEMLDFIDFLDNYCKEIVIVKGNHDVIVDSILEKKNTKSVDYYLWKNIAFLHGDRDFKEIYDKKIEMWVMGHGHPAIVLEEEGGVKKEKYKCFLEGNYREKKIIILPSFFGVVEGTDVRGLDGEELGLAWNFNLKNFKVYVINELDVLEFGKVKNFRDH